MKHVSILALADATLASIDGSHQFFSRINDFMRYQKRPLFYDVEIVGVKKNTRLGGGLYSIHVDDTLDQLKKTDVIVIPLLCGNFTETLSKNAKYKDWVVSQYNANAEIVCLCVGSFFLASTGLLHNKSCAVHWAAKNEFKAMFPQVKIVDDSIITDERRIYTCGGGYSYLNLLLYVVEKHLGRDVAILASKMFEIDTERKSQNPFVIFLGQKTHGDETVLQAQAFIEQNPTTFFSVDQLCDRFGVGRRSFERRFKKNTGNSIVEYTQRVKVEFAKKLLERGDKTVNEISYETGYTDIDSFRKLFKRVTHLSPTAYRKRYTLY